MKKIVFLLYLSLSTFTHSNFLEGMKNYKNSDYGSAFLAWIPLAQAKDGIAQYNIAKLYQLGKGTKKDNKKALRWFKKALKNGISIAKQEIELLQPTFFTNLEAEKLAKLEAKRLRFEKLAKLEADRLETDRLAKLEADRLETRRLEADRLTKLETERLETDRLAKLEADRLETDRLAKLEADRLETRRLKVDRLTKLETDRLETRRLKVDRLTKLETERLDRWKAKNNVKLEKKRLATLEAESIVKRLLKLDWNKK